MKFLYETDVFYKIGSYFHLCFTFTAQIMHHIPILMSYFGDHYAIIGAGEVSESIEAANIDNQKNTLKNKHLRE